jgi:hypothetical protein
MKHVEYVVILDNDVRKRHQMKSFSKLNSMLAFEFQKYLMEHPEMADRIPANALVIFQIEGDAKFNKWSMETSSKNREKKQPMVRVELKKWREASLLKELKISEAA